MDYQKIKLKRYRPKRNIPMISISKEKIRFNNACEIRMNRHYKYCELYYDKDERIIAIKPTNELTENSMKLCKSSGQYAFLSTKNFFRITGIIKLLKLPRKYKSIKLIPSWNERSRMFFLDLRPFLKGGLK